MPKCKRSKDPVETQVEETAAAAPTKPVERVEPVATTEAIKSPEAPIQGVYRPPSDEPLTLDQMRAQGKTEHLVTPAAHQSMRAQGFDDARKNSFNRDLRETVIRRRVEGLKRQLMLAEIPSAVEFLREKRKKDFANQQERDRQYRETLNLRPDSDSPNVESEACVAQASKTCETTFKPIRRFLVIGNKRASRNGREVELGNYGMFRVDSQGNINPEVGELMACGVCRECAQSDKLRGMILYTWQDAQAKIEAVKAEMAAEQDRSKRAEILRRSLVTPEGEPRFNSGNAARDIAETARSLEARRNKRDFQRR